MSMKTSSQKFKDRVSTELGNDFMRGAVSKAQQTIQTRKNNVTEAMGNWEDWRSHGEEIRQHVLENLDYYLYELSEQVAKRAVMSILLKRQKRQVPILNKWQEIKT